VEALSKRLMSGLELLRTDAAQMTTAASRIVEAIDVVRNIGDGQLSVFVDLLLDPLLLSTAEERLGDGVVPTVEHEFAVNRGPAANPTISRGKRSTTTATYS
jgi:hypothetical protein